MTDWSKMVSGSELENAYKERKNEYITIKVKNQDVLKYRDIGYEIFGNPNSKTTVLRKKKEFYDIFENEVWQVFYKMGFKSLNNDNSFKIELPGNSKQIDILAIDDETVIVVECKASEFGTKNFKKEIESISGYFPELRKVLTEKYPNRKIKHIFAVKNSSIELDSNDMLRLDAISSAYFSYETVLYFRDLTNHLGPSAKFQLLGNLFRNTKIQALENKVLAIKGEMGNKDYYTFLIEPEKLLKLAYILHRHNANISNFPTYQRLVKKERLKSVREFVDNGGYFPNSIICSIDGNVKFEPSSQLIKSSISKTGVLHLPQTYMSMYIIDGQHRLYGYSDSKYANTNVIPVVAFINMSKNDQVKLFMDINENQKAVSKSLRNTLNVDLLWDSNIKKERLEALMIKIAESLGEDKDSPLYGRILTGEESKTDKRNITTEIIKSAIKDSKFLNSYNNEIIQSRGTFDKDNNDLTYKFLLSFLKNSLQLIKESNIEEWEKGALGNITINNTSYALIKILDDIVRINLAKNGLAIANDNIFEICQPMIIQFANSLNNLSEDTLRSFRLYGAGGKKKAWRALEVEFNLKNPDFSDLEISSYLDSISTSNHEEASQIIKNAETFIKSLVKAEIVKSSNISALVGKTVYEKMLFSEMQYKLEKGISEVDIELDLWDVVSFEEIVQIIKNGSNWSSFMQPLFNKYNLKYNKQDTIDWLEQFASAQKKIIAKQPIVKSHFDMLKEINSILEVNYH